MFEKNKIILIVAFVIITFTFFTERIFSQNESVNWYFGDHAGIHFPPPSYNPSTALLNGQQYSYEASASISDNSGQLLFYSNGEQVWDVSQNTMFNGNGIAGNHFSTAVIVVPHPGNNNLYYLFTTGEEASVVDGTNYNTINTTLNGGLGGVVLKNVQLLPAAISTEKITAVKHSNGSSYWVVTHTWGDNKFRAFLVSNTGLNINPVISNVGNIHVGLNLGKCGYIKISPDGRKVALASWGLGFIEVLNFNTTSGIVSSSCTSFIDSIPFAYGIEFSPDNSKLYVTQTWAPDTCHLYQYNLNAGNAANILQSKKVIFKTKDSLGALQVTPNKEIYAAILNEDSIGVISFPNNSGMACNYSHNAVSLGGRLSKLGLPIFIQSYFNNPDTSDFSFFNTCHGDSTTFNSDIHIFYDSLLWNFDDINSGLNNHSHLLNPKHFFTSSGTYQVEMIIYNCEGNDTVVNTVIIKDLPFVFLGNDTVICQNSTLTLDAGNSGASYFWNNSSTQQTISVNTSGTYSVTVTQDSCSSVDSIIVTVNSLPLVNLGSDTSICENTTFTLDAGNMGASYIWNVGSSQQTIYVNSSGIYSVTVTENGCSNTDSISVTLFTSFDINVSEDTVICKGRSVQLNASGGINYTWVPANNLNNANIYNPIASPDSTTTYIVSVSNGQCSYSDSVIIYVNALSTLYVPNSFTPNNDGLNDIFRVGSTELTEFHGQIFNRWGNMIYEWYEHEDGWDGKYMGRKAQEGVYIYLINASGQCGKYEINGHVTLIR